MCDKKWFICTFERTFARFDEHKRTISLFFSFILNIEINKFFKIHLFEYVIWFETNCKQKCRDWNKSGTIAQWKNL